MVGASTSQHPTDSSLFCQILILTTPRKNVFLVHVGELECGLDVKAISKQHSSRWVDCHIWVVTDEGILGMQVGMGASVSD